MAVPAQEEWPTDEVSDEDLSTEDDTAAMSDILKTRIESLELSTRTANALAEANIRTLGGLVKKTQTDLLDLDGIGAKGVDEVTAALATLGVSLKDAA